MFDRPSTLDIALPEGLPSRFDSHIVRRLSTLAGQYADRRAYEAALALSDRVVYVVYEVRRPPASGELVHGVSIVHPGKVGDEFFMTRGHFHRPLETAEVYYCLGGRGMAVMETLQGEWAVEELSAGRVLYVPPGWAHRSVNVGAQEDLVIFFVYAGNAAHDYATIEERGFRKLVVERNGRPEIVDNPRWHSGES